MKLFKYMMYKILKHWVSYDDYIKERLKWPYSYEAYSKTLGKETFLNIWLPLKWYLIVLLLGLIELIVIWQFLSFFFELESFHAFLIDIFMPFETCIYPKAINSHIFSSLFFEYPLNDNVYYHKYLYLFRKYAVNILLLAVIIVWLNALFWAFDEDFDPDETTDEELDIYFCEFEETYYSTLLIWFYDRISASSRHLVFLPIYFFHINICVFLLLRYFYPFPYATFFTMYEETVQLFDLLQLLDLYLFFFLPHAYLLFYGVYMVWYDYTKECNWMDHDYDHRRSVDLSIQVAYRIVYISFLYIAVVFLILLYLFEIYFDVTKGFLFLGQRVLVTKYNTFLLEGSLEIPEDLVNYIKGFYIGYKQLIYRIFHFIHVAFWFVFTYDTWYLSQVWFLTSGIYYHMHFPEEIRAASFTCGSWFIMFYMLWGIYLLTGFFPDLFAFLMIPDYKTIILEFLRIFYTYIWLLFLSFIWIKYIYNRYKLYRIPIFFMWLNDNIKRKGIVFIKDLFIYIYICKSKHFYSIEKKDIIIYILKFFFKITGIYVIFRIITFLKNLLMFLLVKILSFYRLFCLYLAKVVEIVVISFLFRSIISFLSKSIIFSFLTKTCKKLYEKLYFFLSKYVDRIIDFLTKTKMERESLYVDKLLEAVEKKEYNIKPEDLDVIKSKAYTERKFVRLLVLKYHKQLLEDRKRQSFLEKMEKTYGKDIISIEDHKQAKHVNMKKYK